jgi:hypothetical protein
MKHLNGETQEDIEDRALFDIPPTPPRLCPSCERESCLLWKIERLRRVQTRAAAKAMRFGLTATLGANKGAQGFIDYAHSLKGTK